MVDIFILNLIKVNISRRKFLCDHKHLQREVYSVIYLWFFIGGILRQILETNPGLSAWVCELCQLFDAGWWVSAETILCLSLKTGWRMSAGSVFCLLLKTWWRMSAGCVHYLLLRAGWRLSAGVCEPCQLFEAGWRLSAWCVYVVCYLRQHGGYLSVAWGRLAVVCKGVCVHSQKLKQNGGYLSVTWGRLTVICQLHEEG
jgi:hypothetical protein